MILLPSSLTRCIVGELLAFTYVLLFPSEPPFDQKIRAGRQIFVAFFFAFAYVS